MAEKNTLKSDISRDVCEMKSYLSDLPVELKLRVFSYVDNQTITQSVALVNKDFNQLTKDYSLYEHYESSDYDWHGQKTVTELNHPLYKSHLKTLITNTDCLDMLDLRQFISLQKIVVDTHFVLISPKECSLPFDSLQNLQDITVVSSDTCSSMAFDVRMISLPIKVDVLRITREEDIKDMFRVSAGRYLIASKMFFRKEEQILQRFLKGDLTYLLEMDNVGFDIEHLDSIFTQDQLYRSLLGKVVKIEMKLICCIASHREVIKIICEHCSNLEYLNLELGDINRFPIIEKVEIHQLQTLVLGQTIPADKKAPFLQRCEQLIRAAKLEVTLNRFLNVPVEILSYLSPSLSSLKLDDCHWCKLTEGFSIQNLSTSLKLIHTSPAPILQWTKECITKLNIRKRISFAKNKTTLESLCFLEEFFMGDPEAPVEAVLEALLPSKDTLRVLQICFFRDHYTLRLLSQFRRLRYLEILGRVDFAKEEIKELFPTAIIKVRKMHKLSKQYEMEVYF